MEDILSISLFVLVICMIVFSLYDVYKNRYITTKQRSNFYFMICAFPVIGSFIYYYSKGFFFNSTNRKDN